MANAIGQFKSNGVELSRIDGKTRVWTAQSHLMSDAFDVLHRTVAANTGTTSNGVIAPFLVKHGSSLTAKVDTTDFFTVGFGLPIQPITATHSSNFSAGEK